MIVSPTKLHSNFSNLRHRHGTEFIRDRWNNSCNYFTSVTTVGGSVTPLRRIVNLINNQRIASYSKFSGQCSSATFTTEKEDTPISFHIRSSLLNQKWQTISVKNNRSSVNIVDSSDIRVSIVNGYDSHSWKVIHMSVKLVTVQNNDSKDKSVDWQMSN